MIKYCHGCQGVAMEFLFSILKWCPQWFCIDLWFPGHCYAAVKLFLVLFLCIAMRLLGVFSAFL